MLLSKSKYLTGLQCPKLLWMEIHKKDELPEIDEGTSFRFSQGHEVGELAKKWFPGGLDIPTDNFKGNLDNTKSFLKFRKPLFEPAIMVDKLYSRADILNPVGDDEWDVIEVKSGGRVKDVNLHDLSFQRYVYEKYGLKIRNCYLMHINTKYVRQGELDVKELFTLEDVTENVEELMEGIQERIDEMLGIMEAEDMPEVLVHIKCNDPYKCGFEDCWDFLPEHNVFDFTRMGKKAFELMEDGVLEIKDVPEDYPLTGNQKIQLKCALDGSVHVDKEKVGKFLDGLKKPLYYLDFEAFNTAIPRFDGCRPYQQIPFQFSLHVDDGEVKHYSFLYKGKDDPRKEFLLELKRRLGDSGSIVVYHQAFEKMVLRELGEMYGEMDWVNGVMERIVDLIVPFRKFWYYNSKQKGKAGLKAVLPALVGKDYSGLEIQDGMSASLAFMSVAFGGVDGDGSGKGCNGGGSEGGVDKDRVYDALEKYCGLDTEGMVWIVDSLKEMV